MIVIDDFLPKHEFIAISHDKHWIKPEDNVFAVREWWGPLSMQNIFFHSCLQMWEAASKQNDLLKQAWNQTVGIEYWTHIFPSKRKQLAYTIDFEDELRGKELPKDYVQKTVRDDLGWHYDRDEGHWNATQELIHPYAVGVLYCHEEREKGMGVLEIQQDGYVQEVDPVPNRLVLFDGTKMHRVAGGDLTKPRRSLCTNMWGHVIHNRAVSGPYL